MIHIFEIFIIFKFENITNKHSSLRAIFKIDYHTNNIQFTHGSAKIICFKAWNTANIINNRKCSIYTMEVIITMSVPSLKGYFGGQKHPSIWLTMKKHVKISAADTNNRIGALTTNQRPLINQCLRYFPKVRKGIHMYGSVVPCQKSGLRGGINLPSGTVSCFHRVETFKHSNKNWRYNRAS